MLNQSRLFQEFTSTINQLEKTLQYQRKIKALRTIPKHYKPKLPHVAQPHTSKLKSSFDAKYEKLFFEHLDEVIVNNTISLNIHKARRNNVVDVTEAELAKADKPPETIKHLHAKFVATNKLDGHVINPLLQRKIAAASSVPQKCKDDCRRTPICPAKPDNKQGAPPGSQTYKRPKRKLQPNPPSEPPKKQAKLDHFLAKSTARFP